MFALPNPLLLPLRIVPDPVHTTVLTRVLNRLLVGQSIAVRLPELDGKVIGIHITDAPCHLTFRITQGRLAAASNATAEVCIRGQLHDFWLLATRREDPDTLFFERRLCIEGDTETGLYLKNLLDSTEFDFKAHVEATCGELFNGTVGRLLRHQV